MIDGAISGVDGQFFIVINIGELIDLDTYQTKINEMIREFKSSRSLKNNNIYLPGEIENQLKIHNTKFGIPLNNETISNLNDVIDNLQLNISLNDLLK